MREAVDDNEVAGDPMNNQKWVRKSLEFLAQNLQEHGYKIEKTTVRRLLKKQDFKLFNNRKTLAPRHPDRDKQFRFIHRVKKVFTFAGHPIISTDAKKKELIGNFKNAGRTWRQDPIKVKDHDFLSEAEGKISPYGIYDIAHNQGTVYVGTSYDTPTFAVYAIAQWWSDPNRPRFKNEDKLLILCDAGGSNSCRYWKWKIEIQRQLADKFGIEVMICHYPTGASKWNPIEHRLFSEISKNWAGEPLLTFQTALNYIQDTMTKTGLTVRAFLVDLVFEKGLKYDKKERENLNLYRYRTCPTWNYTIKPHARYG